MHFESNLPELGWCDILFNFVDSSPRVGSLPLSKLRFLINMNIRIISINPLKILIIKIIFLILHLNFYKPKQTDHVKPV